MVEKYRERYGVVGYAENVVYAGIPGALGHLSSHGARMGVCTSKRADFAEQVLARLTLRHHFEFLSGGDVGVRKEDQLKALVAGGSVGEGSTMIGDRAVDVVAARANGLHSAAVLWGHGPLEELRGAAPDRSLVTPDELTSLVPSG